ncbi:30S ribosomal protein S6e [Candidatus Pacearchaeota archaeon]|nr:MAG: 30S ribosomal protein S6e [Candidatus Pacearchaeota archaeon]
MVFKVNVSLNGKTYKVESENEEIIGHAIGEKIEGELISPELKGYELEITGTSDKAGFPGMRNIEGPSLKRVLLGYGPGMHKKPKGEKKVNRKPKGLRLRKTVRGREISEDTVQINTKVLKEGEKKFNDFFNKKSEEEASSNS